MIETGGWIIKILVQKVKLSRAVLTKHCAVKTYGGSDYRDARFLDLGTIRGEWSALRPGCFTLGETDPGSYWVGGWMDPWSGLDDMEKLTFLTLQALELRSVGRPAGCQLRYRGSQV
jgi:hypothetical protein